LALHFFERALDDVRADSSPEYWPERTRLVVTGDLSIVGDIVQVRAALVRLADVARKKGLVDQSGQVRGIALYGNHDVWPKGFPLWTSNTVLNDHRTNLRNEPPFDQDWPLGPLGPVPMGKHGVLEVHSLNTILHGRIDNSLARGEVKNDRYWTNANLPDQLQQLAAHCNRTPALRVVLTHHPVHRSDRSVASLKNATDVARALAAPCPSGSGRPLAHIVLSGHTHKTFPKPGDLPTALPAGHAPHKPLTDGQAQLTIGTLSQLGWARYGEEHDFQVLRFFLEDDASRSLVLEREIYRRTGRTGPYKKLAGNDPNDTKEHMKLLP